VESFDRLRLRLSTADIDLIWRVLDKQRKGSIEFNEFCVLQELRTSERTDLLQMRAIEALIQTNLAAERKAERDRIAKEMIE
jgi:hypothetical protein